jgi:hypothetical protein
MSVNDRSPTIRRPNGSLKAGNPQAVEHFGFPPARRRG